MSKQYSLAELAAHVGGAVHGNSQATIDSVSTLDEAKSHQITFLANRRYVRKLRETQAGAVVLGEAQEISVPQIVADDPYYAFAQIAILIHGHRRHPVPIAPALSAVSADADLGEGCLIHNFVTICAGAKIGRRCVLYPGAFVGPEARLGDDCILYPNAVVYDGSILGDRVILQANATVGQDGFGYATHRGVHHKIPHLGRVILEDDVEIGSNAAIERGTVQDTVIGKGAKIGDQVAIGHGAVVGAGCLLVAQVGIAGSTTLGRYCVLGGQVGIAGHIKIGDGVKIGAQSGIASDIPAGATVFGAPAFEARKALTAYSQIKSLPEMRKRLAALEQRLKELEDRPSGTFPRDLKTHKTNV